MHPNMNKDALTACLTESVGFAPSWTRDEKGNLFGWLRLSAPSLLPAAAKALADLGVRLCTITAYAEQRDDPEKRRSIAYHFAYYDALMTVAVPIYHADTYEKCPVPSITPWFRNADWNEREFNEMYNIDITGHPNPKRLFLDERIDAGVMAKLIPFSAMVHGVSSRTLWERVMQAKTGASPRAVSDPHAVREVKEAPAVPVVEPKFTPVSATADKAMPAEMPVVEEVKEAASTVAAESVKAVTPEQAKASVTLAQDETPAPSRAINPEGRLRPAADPKASLEGIATPEDAVPPAKPPEPSSKGKPSVSFKPSGEAKPGKGGKS